MKTNSRLGQRRGCLLVLLASLVATDLSQADVLDRVFSSVVFLYQDQIETGVVDSETNEVWLRPLSKAQPTPSINRIEGSGFLCIANNHGYLVTARHVANSNSLSS